MFEPFDMSAQTLLFRGMLLVPLILSLTVHEFAHAWSAWLLGDDTAARQGRMTLDPLVHIDPIGTFLLPLMGVPFGWAKPVPVNPAGFKRSVSMRTGMMITAAAGPLSNLVLAVLAGLIYGALFRFAPYWMVEHQAVAQLVAITIPMNLGLAVFNLIPLPPLDGSRIVDGLVPYRHQHHWENLTRYSPILLLVVIVFGGRYLSGPISTLNETLHGLIGRIFGYA